MATTKMMLLDTASLYFRAYYGVPDSFRAPDGRPVNAVRGLADFIATLAGRYHPTHLVCCWDNDWRPGWRVAAIPSYKAHRLANPADALLPPVVADLASVQIGRIDPHPQATEETPDGLVAQVPLIIDLLTRAGIPILGADHHEADDVIGTLAATSPMPVDVVTGDRDLFQVVDDARGVRVLFTAKGVGRHVVYDGAAVVARYGVLPEQYADFAALRGDASDGLPGVAGIGEKTAASLLATYGDVEDILRAAADPGGGLAAGIRAKLGAAKDYLAAAHDVVRVATDLANPVPWEALRVGPIADIGAWAAFAERTNLGGAATRLAAALASTPQDG